MRPPEKVSDLLTRITDAKNFYKKRNDLIKLVRAMYWMDKNYPNSFLGLQVLNWRKDIPDQYWEASNTPNVVVDMMTGVLTGNSPIYTCSVPGDIYSTIPSQGEMFIDATYRINSLRQQRDLYATLAFKMVQDGGAGLKIYWDPAMPKPDQVLVEDGEDGRPKIIGAFSEERFPIVVDIISLDRLLPMGRGRLGQPFDEIVETSMRTGASVLYEWQQNPDADVEWLRGRTSEQLRKDKTAYYEWWGQDENGIVYQAVLFDNKYVVPAHPTEYPCLPYVVAKFREVDSDTGEKQAVPFIYNIIWATVAKEYYKAKQRSLVDLYAGMLPYHKGDQPLGLEGAWGDVIELDPDDVLEFARWPGVPPDILRLIQDSEKAEHEGTFSEAMFGNISGRMSGYGLSQLIGADSLKSEIPAKNFGLALAAGARIIFKLLTVFAKRVHVATTIQAGYKKMSTMLSGYEADSLIVECTIKPKHIADDVRLASLGAQMASMPRSPVSLNYILEKFFSIPQPEQELDRKMLEQAQEDPIIRLIALLDVLREQNHPAAFVIEKQLQDAIGSLTQQSPGPEGQPGPQQLGMGVPQATLGNPPGEEGLPNIASAAALFGGPQPE